MPARKPVNPSLTSIVGKCEGATRRTATSVYARRGADRLVALSEICDLWRLCPRPSGGATALSLGKSA